MPVLTQFWKGRLPRSVCWFIKASITGLTTLLLVLIAEKSWPLLPHEDCAMKYSHTGIPSALNHNSPRAELLAWPYQFAGPLDHQASSVTQNGMFGLPAAAATFLMSWKRLSKPSSSSDRSAPG